MIPVFKFENNRTGKTITIRADIRDTRWYSDKPEYTGVYTIYINNNYTQRIIGADNVKKFMLNVIASSMDKTNLL